MKYTDKQRLKAVQAYMTGNHGLRATAGKQGVGFDSLRLWVAAYREHGEAGVKERTQKLQYAPELRLEIVNRIRDEGLSYRQAAAIYGIRRFDLIAIWQRAYAKSGLEGLTPMRPGPRKRTDAVEGETIKPPDDAARSRQDLLDELRQLRMEVAYLKKARALVRSKSPSPSKNGRE